MDTIYKEIVRFIRDLYHGKDIIPLHEPVFSGNEKRYLSECIDSSFVSSVGKFVDRFEQTICNYTGSEHAVATSSGTSALHIALLLAGTAPGDEVITQPLSFVATSNAIRHCNADPVFVDVDESTLGMSPGSLERFLHECTRQDNDGSCVNKRTGKRIIACVPVHILGHPAQIDRIIEICAEKGISVIEDAAESLGSLYRTKHTGTFGKFGILSFNGNKIITTGGGGMILTEDLKLAQRARHLTTQAKIDHPYRYIHDEVGYNYRLTNIQAAVGLAQMERLEEILSIKRRIANEYMDFFISKGIRLVHEPENARSNFWLNAIRFPGIRERDGFLDYAIGQGILARPLWDLMSSMDMYRKYESFKTAISESMMQEIVTLPSSVPGAELP